MDEQWLHVYYPQDPSNAFTFVAQTMRHGTFELEAIARAQFSAPVTHGQDDGTLENKTGLLSRANHHLVCG